MSLRIEQVSPLSFLVTKAVCSDKDQFVKKTSRELCDFRAKIHKICLEKSIKYFAQSVSINHILTEDKNDFVGVTIDTWCHNSDMLKDKAYLFTFSYDPDPISFHSIIFDIFRNENGEELFVYY